MVADIKVAQVLLPLPLGEAFDYAVPEEMDLAAGDLVVVPLGPRQVQGVVGEVGRRAGVNRSLKSILGKVDAPPLTVGVLEFVAWAARYGADSPGKPLAMALRGLSAPRPPPRRHLVATAKAPQRMTPSRQRVLTAAAEPVTGPDLARQAMVSPAVIRGLVVEGALAESWIGQPLEPFAAPDLDHPGPKLNSSQAAAATRLSTLVGDGFATALLDGVTGSGKTEVYLEAIASALRGRPTAQVLVLAPEIALTAAMLARFETRFGAAPVEWHSAIAPLQRRRSWEAVARGEARIIVGARSALFLPFTDLAMVVVDEEHDGAYKQEEGFIYHARDLAVARARIADCPVVLASATPSLETLWNARAGRYLWLRLEARHGAARLPPVSLIDLREHPPERGAWLSRPLIDAIAATLAAGEQSLLFLNRRGYAPLVLCKSCGERLKAPDSDSWLVEHRYSGRLVCHISGFSMPRPRLCPHCSAEDSLVSVGPGVERIAEETIRLFPDARVAIFSSDTPGGADGARALIEAMTKGEIDVLIATQAAAKGHDFPGLTFVGVVDADLGLRGGDLRASERTFQLLTQVAGRAGRRSRPGRAFLQTWLPEHPVMAALAAQDRDAFVEVELSERQAAGLPPFTRLAAVVVSGPDPAQLEEFCQTVAEAAPNTDGVDVFGPADAPLGLIRGRRRKRFLVRAERSVDLSAYMAAWRARLRPPGALRLSIDIDPYSFF